MQRPSFRTTADDKPSQGNITFSQIIATPEIQLALDNMQRWTPEIKAGVAKILSNRTSFVRSDATAEEDQQFDLLIAEVERCMKTDTGFAELMDPSFVIVDFRGAAVPAGYRGWLEQVNANIGGAPVGAAGEGNFNVTAGEGNQPIRLMDPSLNNLNLLHVNTRANADHVAGQLLILGGLHAWVLEGDVAPTYL